jgi:hypothetical protein
MKTLVVYVPESRPTISTRFFESWLKMTSPAIQDQLAKDYEVKLIPMIETRHPLDLNRNQAVERALSDHKADYIMFCDADMIFPENTIPNLLKLISDEYPVVSGVYWLKKPPHPLIAGIYLPWNADLELKRHSLETQGFVTATGAQTLYHERLTVCPESTYEVDVAGMGCVLVRADVFGSFQQPYFKYVNQFSTEGDYTFRRGVSEEMWFYSLLKKAGIKTLLDPSVKCGHLSESVYYGAEQRV